jgi:hypothetical protein
METIKRNDCVNDRWTFYHRGSGFPNTTMQTATIPILLQDSRHEDGRRLEASFAILSTAETAECTCPEWCERDHDRD